MEGWGGSKTHNTTCQVALKVFPNVSDNPQINVPAGGLLYLFLFLVWFGRLSQSRVIFRVDLFKRNQIFDEHESSRYHCMFMIFADK